MKAVKIYKIKWILDDLDPAEQADAKKKLPEVKGFTCSDDFDVAGKVPELLKNKFGYDIETFSYSEIHIITDLKELILLGAPKGEKKKEIFRPNGKMNVFGRQCMERLEEMIKKRKEMEASGVDQTEMSTAMDELMLAVESVTGLNWEDNSAEELFDKVLDKLSKLSRKDILTKYNPLKGEDEEDDDELDRDDEGIEE